MSKDLLQRSEKCFEHIRQHPYPDGYSIGPWWTQLQNATAARIRGFQSPEEAIAFAQKGQNSGFDHRYFDIRKATAIAQFKIRELEKLFPGWSLKETPKESPFSDKNSLILIDGEPCSSIFFTHLAYYLRCASIAKGKRMNRILEIGGGYGALARIFHAMDHEATYVIIDLAESLFYAQLFLSLNFPDAKIAYLMPDESINLDEHDFVLIPVQSCQALAGQAFDFVINTGSLQEMPQAAIAFWMRFIQETIKPRFFYSFNYFLVNKRALQETDRNEINWIGPVLDPFWDIRHFEINPEVLTVDADKRNWLEVGVERIIGSGMGPKKTAERLYREAITYPRGSNYWFSRIWMSIWCDPREDYVREIIAGIELFKRENAGGMPKNYCRRPHLTMHEQFRSMIRNIRYRRRLFNPDLSDFSELKFYKDLLNKGNR